MLSDIVGALDMEMRHAAAIVHPVGSHRISFDSQWLDEVEPKNFVKSVVATWVSRPT
jgi:hypothetical protein